MQKKIILMILLSFSLFMFGCSSNNKLTEEIANRIETSIFTISETNQFGRTIKTLYEAGYVFEEINSPKEHYIRIQKEENDFAYGRILIYEDGESSKSHGWTSNASEEDKQTIKNILGIN